MATLKQFLETGELGPIHPGMNEAEVNAVLGTPQDESIANDPRTLKYGALQLTFLKDPETVERHLAHIGLYFAPHAEPIPELTQPEDFSGGPDTTIADIREFLSRAGLAESAFVNGDDANYLIMPSGARITFDEKKLHSINFARPRSGPAKKQISIPVPKETFDEWQLIARQAKKSVAELIAEGIPSMKRKTGSFQATGTDGRSYTILIYTDFIYSGLSVDPHADVEGRIELRTLVGRPVNRIDKGSYQIVDSGVMLQSDSPVAP